MRPHASLLTAAIVVGAAAAAPAQGAAAEQLTLAAAQSAELASWQRPTWQASRAWCRHSAGGHQRWRLVLAHGSCGTVVRSAALTAGQDYLVTISGLVSHWARGRSRGRRVVCGTPPAGTELRRGRRNSFEASADPAWTFAVAGPPGRCRKIARRLPRRGTNLVVNTAAGAAPEGWRGPGWQPPDAVSPDHSYSFTVRGAGRPILLALRDSWVTDNAGAFTVTIAPAS